MNPSLVQQMSWEPTLNTIILLVSLILQTATILFFAGKLANRIDSLERRMTDSETDIKHWTDEVTRLAAIDAKLTILIQEMDRVRNRVDKYLDSAKTET